MSSVIDEVVGVKQHGAGLTMSVDVSPVAWI
jgi:hypothetical protein